MNYAFKNQKNISMVLKVIIAFCAIAGTALSIISAKGSFMSGFRTFMYFTTQSNIAMAIISLMGLRFMLQNRVITERWWTIRFVGAVAITLTGVVFCFVLAPNLGPESWNVHNVMTHVIVPVASVADFFIIGINGKVARWKAVYVIIPPIVYAIYAGIGYALNWQFAEGYNYPYFFLNWGSPAGAFGFTADAPYMGCGWWIIAIFFALLLVGTCYLILQDALRRKVFKTT